MGSAVDYSMANAQRAAMQSVADATVLALARIMPTSQATLNTKGVEWFNANLGTAPLTGMQLTITPAGAQGSLTATGLYKTRRGLGLACPVDDPAVQRCGAVQYAGSAVPDC